MKDVGGNFEDVENGVDATELHEEAEGNEAEIPCAGASRCKVIRDGASERRESGPCSVAERGGTIAVLELLQHIRGVHTTAESAERASVPRESIDRGHRRGAHLPVTTRSHSDETLGYTKVWEDAVDGVDPREGSKGVGDVRGGLVELCEHR